jgi:uncharacterized protein (DUF697 family)
VTDEDLSRELERITAGEADRGSIGRLTRAVAGSAKAAGRRAVLSGQWAAEQIVDLAPRIPVRDLATLKEHHGGLSGAALAGELIRNASRTAGAVGMASGAMMSAEEFAPPAWVAIPLELVVETLAVVAIELKLVAELHEVYGRPVEGTGSERATALVKAWAERRGVTPSVLTKPGGLSEVLGKGTRNELIRVARRRMLQRMGRNLSSLAPLMIGAVAGAEVNRRATRALGEAVVRDLAVARPA